jgi:hypothetical protein
VIFPQIVRAHISAALLIPHRASRENNGASVLLNGHHAGKRFM